MRGAARLSGVVQESSLYVLLFLLPFSKSAIEILFGVLLLAWLAERVPVGARAETIWRNPRLRPLAWALGLTLAAFALSIPLSDYPAKSIRGFIGKWVEYLLMVVLAAELGRRSRVVERALTALAWATAFVVVEAVSQEFLGAGLFLRHPLKTYYRMTGPYENPIDLAAFFMVAVPCLTAFAVTRRGWFRWLIGGVVLAAVGCLGRTMAFGVWLGVGLAALAMAAAGPPALRRGVLLMAAATVLSVGFFLHRTGMFREVVTLSDVGTSDRVVMWQAAVNMIKDRPVLGHGVNTFMANYLKYWVGGERQPRYAHNCYLQVAAETGLIGLASFLWLLWVLHRTLWSSIRGSPADGRTLLVGVWAGLVAFAAQSAMDTHFYALRQAALFWMCAGLAVGLSERLASGPDAS